jgi:hypothetical protein
MVQADVSEEQNACGGQGDINHPPAPSHVQGGSSGRGGAQDTLHGGSYGVSYLHLESTGLSEELPYHLLLKIKVLPCCCATGLCISRS